MPVALLAGLPREYLKRIRASVDRGLAEYRAGWELIYLPARHDSAAIAPGQVGEVLERSAQSQLSHVIGVSTQDKAVRRDIDSRIRQFFRFRWLDTRLFRYIPHAVPEFVNQLNVVLEEEELWTAQVKPTDVASPLLLPRCSFEADGMHGELWVRAEEFGEPGNIRATGRAVKAFRDRHWLPTSSGGRRWVDTRHRVFNHTGARHAEAPHPRCWKYSFPIPVGFHYDVSAGSGQAFRMRDAKNINHEVGKGGYLNVDPHGYVRR